MEETWPNADSNILHVHSPYHWHDEAYVVGTKAGLMAIRDAIDKAIRDGRSSFNSNVCDGEGFVGHVIMTDKPNSLAVPYTDEIAGNNAPTALHPWELPEPTQPTG